MRKMFLVICLLSFCIANVFSQEKISLSKESSVYKYKQTQELVSLVKYAALAIEEKGEAAFPEFKKENSQWRHDDIYIFIIDTNGNMVLHPDLALEGKNQMKLKDASGKLIIRGFIDVTSNNKREGWFHYQWPEPGSIFPRWKSSFVQLVTAPSGKNYIVGSGLYDMKIEKEFIVTLVGSAAELIEKKGKAAFPALRDRTGQFIFKDIYIFVDRPDGVEVVNGAFPSLEGTNFIDYKDSKGNYLALNYINVALTEGSGWVDYLWPKPGETIPSEKQR